MMSYQVVLTQIFVSAHSSQSIAIYRAGLCFKQKFNLNFMDQVIYLHFHSLLIVTYSALVHLYFTTSIFSHGLSGLHANPKVHPFFFFFS